MSFEHHVFGVKVPSDQAKPRRVAIDDADSRSIRGDDSVRDMLGLGCTLAEIGRSHPRIV